LSFERENVWAALVLIGLALLMAGCKAGPVTHGVPNFATVAPGIYRGGQPTSEGWNYLRSVGVSNVVKLNTASEGSDDQARAMGMWVVDWPITLGQQLGLERISPFTIFLEIRTLNLEPGKPERGLFIHCEHGQDRTGLFVACYRVTVQGWTKAAAEKEMLALGFHKELRGLWEFWEGLK
jgi:hypothetical protein